MKKILLLFFSLSVITAVVLIFFWKGNDRPRYSTEPVTRGDIEATVTATGTVNAVTTVLVGTQVSGTIKNIYVDFNSPVKKGQAIAQIDPSIFQAQVDQAMANHQAAKAGLEKSRTAFEDSKRTMSRNKELYGRNLIARSELDTSETNYDSARAQIGASQAQVAQTEAALKMAETNLQYTRIVSPVNGIVVSRNVDVGQTVAASFQTPTLFTIAEDLTKMQVNSSVAEADIGKLKSGLPVEFTVDAYPEITFTGKISEIRNAPIIVQNVVTYDVVIKVNNPELKLKPGMTANLSIVYSSRKGALRVPNAALRFAPQNLRKNGPRPEGHGVWVLVNGEPERVKVTTGISDGNFTELVSGDVKEGQELIVESLEKTKGGQSGPRMF